MRSVVYSMSMSLDGYIAGPDGGFNWSMPDEDVFRAATEEVRGVGVHLLGRKLYETMVYWETAEEEGQLDALEVEFAHLWKALPKVVFSSRLTGVVGNTRLASGTLIEEIQRLRDDPADDCIAIGGATLAAAVADLGLIDEYRIRIYPVLVGGGLPFFAHHGRRDDLELVENRTLGGGVAYLRYRVVR